MKSKNCLLCLLFSFFLVSWTLPQNEIDPEELKQFEEDQKAYQTYIGDVNDLRKRFADQMKDEFGLLWSGDRGRMHGTIEELGMFFQVERRATVEEARALHLLVMEKFIEAINACEKIRPFLKTSPFTYKNVGISIDFRGINGSHSDGTIDGISNASDSANPPNQNCIFYSTWDPFHFSSTSLFMESREEAIERNRTADIKNPAIHQITEKEGAIDRLFYAFRMQMAHKYRFECWSIGGKMNENIEEIGAHFVVVNHVSQEEARALILDLARSLIKAVNSNETLRPYFAEDPFPITRLKLYLGFRTKTYGTYFDGSMESVVLEGGKVSYFQKIPRKKGEKPGTIPIHVPLYATESYEEALKILQETPKPSLCKKLLSKCSKLAL